MYKESPTGELRRARCGGGRGRIEREAMAIIAPLLSALHAYLLFSSPFKCISLFRFPVVMSNMVGSEEGREEG